MVGGRRKLYNEELHNLYSLANIMRIIKLRRMRWAGHVARMRKKKKKKKKKNACRILVGKGYEKRQLGRLEWGDMQGICLAKGRKYWRALVSALMKLRVP
jgi:ABC-type Mn2+/Zn2+ transport system ATPase subunit